MTKLELRLTHEKKMISEQECDLLNLEGPDWMADNEHVTTMRSSWGCFYAHKIGDCYVIERASFPKLANGEGEQVCDSAITRERAYEKMYSHLMDYAKRQLSEWNLTHSPEHEVELNDFTEPRGEKT